MMKNRFQNYCSKFLADNTMRNPLLALTTSLALIAPAAHAKTQAVKNTEGRAIKTVMPVYPPLPTGYPSAKHKAAERMGDRSPQSVRRPFLYRLRTERTGPTRVSDRSFDRKQRLLEDLR
ncbi:MAG: hypothetical protein ACFNNL_02285, partial [Kingella oralis]